MAGMDMTVEVLEHRLDRLEQENRRLKRVGSVVLIGIAALVLMGQARTPSRVIEGEEFVLRDSGGRVRAALGMETDGSPGLWLYDRDGKLRAELALGADGAPGLRLGHRDGKSRVTLDLGADGAFVLGVADRNRRSRITLVVDADGNPNLNLFDENRRRRAILGYSALEKLPSGAVEIRPPSSLVLFDKDGKVMWRAP